MNWRSIRERLGERPSMPVSPQDEAERLERTRALGRGFRDARQRAGVSLTDAEATTRINRVYLEAIEDGRFQDLPAPVYARGFVRSYARYLGLDAEESVAAMPDLARPGGLEPIPGLRRTVAPLLPAVNLPIAGAIGAAIGLALLAYFVLPGLGGGDPPADETPPLTITTATSTPATTPVEGEETPPPSTATVPPFDEGTAPDFRGVSRETAQTVARDLGATPLFVDASSELPAGVIFNQSPEPGTGIEEGDVITLFVSTGP